MNLSIISITKNDIPGIRKTLLSTRLLRKKQGISHVVIDSSESDTAIKVKKICKEEEVIYERCERAGIANAFNTGIEKVDSGWIWFLNGGDAVIKNLDTTFFCNYLTYCNADIIVFLTFFEKTQIVRQFPPLWDLWPVTPNWIPQPSTIVTKEVFQKYGTFNFNYKIAMDGEFWLRLMKNKRVTANLVSIPIASFNEDGVSNVNIVQCNREQIIASYKYFFSNFFLYLYSLLKMTFPFLFMRWRTKKV